MAICSTYLQRRLDPTASRKRRCCLRYLLSASRFARSDARLGSHDRYRVRTPLPHGNNHERTNHEDAREHHRLSVGCRRWRRRARHRRIQLGWLGNRRYRDQECRRGRERRQDHRPGAGLRRALPNPRGCCRKDRRTRPGEFLGSRQCRRAQRLRNDARKQVRGVRCRARVRGDTGQPGNAESLTAHPCLARAVPSAMLHDHRWRG